MKGASVKFNSLSDAEKAVEQLLRKVNEEFSKLIRATDEQKGELLFLQTLSLALLRSMPPEIQLNAAGQLGNLVESVRRSHLYSDASDDVIRSFDHYAALHTSPKP